MSSEMSKDEPLTGFDPKTIYAIKKLQARYPHAKDVLSALLADVEKNELDGDNADTENKRLIKKLEQKLLDVIKKNDLKESVKENDLRELVINELSIDQYKSKLGNDEKIIVMAIKVKDKEPADDLSQFIESALIEDVLDVDVSPGPNEKGEYTVFVEMPRHSNAYSVVERIISDIQKVDKTFVNPMFKAYENKELQQLTKDNFEHSIILDARDYQLQHNTQAKEISERMKFLVRY